MIQHKIKYLVSTVIAMSTFLFFIISCEKDDVCIDTPITPQVQIVFDDFESITTGDTIRKRVVGLLVEQITPNSLSDKILLNSASTDSISLPLNVNEDRVSYKFTENFGAEDSSIIRENILEFIYDRNNIYVNRACGFKTDFKITDLNDDTDAADDTKWINSIRINNRIINNEEKRHITIFH